MKGDIFVHINLLLELPPNDHVRHRSNTQLRFVRMYVLQNLIVFLKHALSLFKSPLEINSTFAIF